MVSKKDSRSALEGATRDLWNSDALTSIFLSHKGESHKYIL